MFWGCSNLLPSSHLAKPRWFWHQGWSRGSRVGGLGPALVLLWVLPALSPARWPRASAWSQIWAPLLPAGLELLTLEKGANPNPPSLPALQHGQALEERAACACSICWEPGKGWPCQMCEHSWSEAVPMSLSSYFNPKFGLLVPH